MLYYIKRNSQELPQVESILIYLTVIKYTFLSIHYQITPFYSLSANDVEEAALQSMDILERQKSCTVKVRFGSA